MRLLHTATAGFEAARSLAGVRHGHSFRLSACSTEYALAPLQSRLRQLAATLDYRDLDDRFAEADDLSLVHFLAEQLGAPAELSLRSAPECGVCLPAGAGAQRWLDVRFEAAHRLPHVAPGHQCGRLHGHGFGVRIAALAAKATPADLRAAWLPCYAQLQHACLNALPGLENPTSEVLAAWLFQRLALPGLLAVEVYETASAGSRFDGDSWRIWKTLRFEAAVPFDAVGRYTGHSYLARLHLSGQLDPAFGWVCDFADVKAGFNPLYQALDHHALDALPGLYDTSCAGVALYLARRFAMPGLARIDVLENETDGAQLWLEDACTR